MKKLLLLFVFILTGIVCTNAQNYQDVVYLKNGSVIKGIIIEQIPNETIKIQTNDGSIYIYEMAAIEKMGKEQKRGYASKPQYEAGYTKKSPVLAFCASFLISGLGQIYNEQYGKAALFFCGYYGSFICGQVGANVGDNGMIAVGSLGIIVFGLWNLIDAPISSSRLNRENLITFSNGTSLKIMPDMVLSTPTFSTKSQTATLGAKLQYSF